MLLGINYANLQHFLVVSLGLPLSRTYKIHYLLQALKFIRISYYKEFAQ